MGDSRQQRSQEALILLYNNNIFQNHPNLVGAKFTAAVTTNDISDKVSAAETDMTEKEWDKMVLAETADFEELDDWTVLKSG